MTVLDIAPVRSQPAAPDRSAAADLVQRCRAGDQQAWADLVRACNPLVWTVARSFGLPRADCEEVCQATWLRVVENIGELREPGKVATWIATAARREALRLAARADRQVPVGNPGLRDIADVADVADGPEEAAMARADAAVLMAAFRLLPQTHQRLLRMLVADRPSSYDEISAALRMPRGSIGPTRARILRSMRDHLAA